MTHALKGIPQLVVVDLPMVSRRVDLFTFHHLLHLPLCPCACDLSTPNLLNKSPKHHKSKYDHSFGIRYSNRSNPPTTHYPG